MSKSQQSPILVRRLLVCALVACLPAPAAFAQSANAALRGQVDAPAGTEVTATEVATGVVAARSWVPTAAFR